jgi:hypothetical protein
MANNTEIRLNNVNPNGENMPHQLISLKNIKIESKKKSAYVSFFEGCHNYSGASFTVLSQFHRNKFLNRAVCNYGGKLYKFNGSKGIETVVN